MNQGQCLGPSNIRHHLTKLSCLGDQGLCTPAVYFCPMGFVHTLYIFTHTHTCFTGPVFVNSWIQCLSTAKCASQYQTTHRCAKDNRHNKNTLHKNNQYNTIIYSQN